MISSTQSMRLALGGMELLALGMGFANAAVFKLVPKFMPETVGGTAGIVGGLGAFGGFVLPVLMGLFVVLFGTEGYSMGFSILGVLAAGCLVISLLFIGGPERNRNTIPPA